MRRHVLVGFATLCLLSASTWLLDNALPSPLPGVEQLAFAASLIGGGCALAERLSRRPSIPKPRKIGIALWAAVVFALPAVLLFASEGRLSSTTEVLIYTLIPAATVFVIAQTSDDGSLRQLGPALAGSAGAALILPFDLPSSLAGRLWFAAIALSAMLVAYGCLRLHRLLQGHDLLRAAPLASIGPCLAGVVLWHMSEHGGAWSWMFVCSCLAHLTLTGVLFWLTLWLLRDTLPVALSTRFLLIPLLTVMEGYALLRPPLAWTLVAGILLLAGGSLLLWREEHQS